MRSSRRLAPLSVSSWSGFGPGGEGKGGGVPEIALTRQMTPKGVDGFSNQLFHKFSFFFVLAILIIFFIHFHRRASIRTNFHQIPTIFHQKSLKKLPQIHLQFQRMAVQACLYFLLAVQIVLPFHLFGH